MSGYLGSLSAEQEELLKEFKQRVSKSLYEALMAAKGEPAQEKPADQYFEAAKALMDDREKSEFDDDRIFLRFLRARRWDVNAAHEMYINAAKFRREFHGIGVRNITEDMIVNELKTGKSFFYKYDKMQRPITYVFPRRHLPSETDMTELEKYTIFCLETGKDLLRLPQEKSCIVYDMSGFGLSNMDYEYMKFQINVMQNYYPECMGVTLVVNAPWIFWTVWNLIQYWIDPAARKKVVFVTTEQLREYIDPENLPVEFGGLDPFEYKYVPPSERDGTDYVPTWQMPFIHEPYTPFDPATDRPDTPLVSQSEPALDHEEKTPDPEPKGWLGGWL